jgi:hypothetical protein
MGVYVILYNIYILYIYIYIYICKDKKMVTPQLLNILLHISIRMRDLVVSVVFPAHKIHGITGVADELELVIDY